MRTWVNFFRKTGRLFAALLVVGFVVACNRSAAPPSGGAPERIVGAAASEPAMAIPAKAASGAATGQERLGSTSPDAQQARPASVETALLAGGCFWGMEDILRKVPGVVETEVGYIGGSTSNPTYNDVHLGTTGHAEAVRIVFDSKQLSYADLLENWFFKMHDPTTKNRQGNDVGSQYRSAIFTTSLEQRAVAERVKARVEKLGHWKAPIVTEIVEAGAFTPAEAYHQDYLEKDPAGYTCHFMRVF